MAQLQVQVADGEVRTIPLAGKAVTVGRADDCDVVISEQKASRKHCRVEPKGDGWRVVDEGSSNGTWLGGRPVLAARLKPGDELEIGETVLTFVDESAPPAAVPREVRKPRVVARKPTPWVALVVPVLVAVVAYFVVAALGKSHGAEGSAALVRYAKSEAERASLEKDPARRKDMLEEARRLLAARPDSAEALTALDTPAEGAAPGTDVPAPGAGDAWRAALESFDADRTASGPERRVRLAELLDRYVDDADALTAIRARLKSELTTAGQRIRLDREETFKLADQDVADGQYGAALTRWLDWIARVPAVTPEDEKAIAERLSSILDKASLTAKQAAFDFERARKEGRAEAAQSILEAGAKRLEGTGFDVWLLARGTDRPLRTGKTDKPAAAESESAASTRERTKALQLSGQGEALAHKRRFTEAASKLDEAAAAVSDALLKRDIQSRAEDVRAEAAFLAKLLAEIASAPAKFGSVKIGDRTFRVAGAGAADVSLAGQDGKTEAHPVTELSSGVFVQLVDKATLEKTDHVAAALLLRDVGEDAAYEKWMRQALTTDDREQRMAASRVHARYLGQPVPTDGFMPHPRDGRSIVTHDESVRIVNEEKIKAARGRIEKLLEKIESSKQSKSVENVRKAYAKLEAARNHALELIFNEEKYFYPYRDRMREYAPVSKEVDDRVKAVREAWEVTTSAKIRTDAALDKLIAESERIVDEIESYKGEPKDYADLVARVDAVRMYLGSDLSVQTFFENAADRELAAYNAKVMKYNPTVKGPTDAEREQVRVTNEYRIMFGHRRVLRIHPSLVISARGHSTDMSNLGFFDHTSPVPGKEQFDDRIKLAGYVFAGCSENIQSGRGDPASAHDGWTHSSGHHRNLLSPGWVEMGSGAFGGFWTQNFGFRIDDDWEGGVPK